MYTFLTASSGSTAAAGGSTIIMLVVMVVIFYFLLIRPENKKKKQMDAMRSSLKVGDKITTIGGIVGTIVHIKEDNIVIETSADRVRMELAKWSVSTNNTQEAQKAASKPTKKSKK